MASITLNNNIAGLIDTDGSLNLENFSANFDQINHFDDGNKLTQIYKNDNLVNYYIEFDYQSISDPEPDKNITNMRVMSESQEILYEFSNLNVSLNEYLKSKHINLFDGEDNVTGNSQNDIIKGHLDDDVLDGKAGDDVIDITTIENITSGSGHDTLTGQWLDNVLDGGDGHDKLYGNAGNDTLKGGLGNDTLNGGAGIDTIVYGDGSANVSLLWSFNNKYQNTGHGYDVIDITTIENITSGSGDDTLTGQWLDNVLDGGDGHDKLYGNAGNDTLKGGLGNDTLNGGVGADIYLFNSNDGQDTIEDFNILEGDKIRLMKTNDESSDITYSTQGNDTVIIWNDLSITLNNFQDEDQIAQHIEWTMIG